jgi:hypothetical protein
MQVFSAARHGLLPYLAQIACGGAETREVIDRADRPRSERVERAADENPFFDPGFRKSPFITVTRHPA